ncbi:MAG: hypothetical protein KAX38_04235 [Candidatus Krumholzibacteria bacterium]|nr:hypothetical protein [Candidatus Krumholzibacteria bacterium]
MIMRLRQPDRRRFRSTIKDRRRRKREYYYASISILVVKIGLFVLLWILFSVSVRLFRYKFSHITPLFRYAIPAVVAVFALFLGYYIYRNIKEIIELSRDRHS